MGPYSLSLDSSHRFELDPIPQEGAGMYRIAVGGKWEGESAAGGPSAGSKYGERNPRVGVEVAGETEVM
jgi:calpain-7